MTSDKQTAAALAETFTAAQIRDYRTAALKVKLEGGTVTRSYEGSSFTINVDNCAQIIADCGAALGMITTAALGDDPDLTREPAGVGFDFSHRQCS